MKKFNLLQEHASSYYYIETADNDRNYLRTDRESIFQHAINNFFNSVQLSQPSSGTCYGKPHEPSNLLANFDTIEELKYDYPELFL